MHDQVRWAHNRQSTSVLIGDREIEVPQRFRGDLILPDDPAYEAAIAISNARARGRPAAVARCLGAADVRSALALAREHALEISVRGGGHHVAGFSSNDGGLVIDLTKMRNVHVDPATSTAWIGGGVLAGDALLEALEFGLVPVTGASANVGLGGLSLGIGEGYLTPKHGFAADNVLELEVVTAAGDLLRVSAESHPDLFFAMRGAGANFGVVTGMRVKLHPVPRQAIGGWIVFGERDLLPVTTHILQAMEHGSEDFWPLVVYGAGKDGRPEVSILPAHVGPPELAKREIDALRSQGTPIRDEVGAMSYADLVFGFPDRTDSGDRTAWDLYRFEFGGDVERQIEVLLDQVRSWPSGGTDAERQCGLWRTVPRAAPDPPSAVPRLPGTTLCPASLWKGAASDERELRWLDETARALAGVACEGANAMNHVAFPTEQRVKNVYGHETYERLAQIKATYDPDNIFRRNFNIRPATQPAA